MSVNQQVGSPQTLNPLALALDSSLQKWKEPSSVVKKPPQAPPLDCGILL